MRCTRCMIFDDIIPTSVGASFACRSSQGWRTLQPKAKSWYRVPWLQRGTVPFCSKWFFPATQDIKTFTNKMVSLSIWGGFRLYRIEVRLKNRRMNQWWIFFFYRRTLQGHIPIELPINRHDIPINMGLQRRCFLVKMFVSTWKNMFEKTLTYTTIV